MAGALVLAARAGPGNSAPQRPATETAVGPKRMVASIRPARIDILRQIVRLQTEQVLLLGLFYNTSPLMVASRLRNVDRGATYNAQDWDVR